MREVVAQSLTRNGFRTSNVDTWLDRVCLDQPAGDLLAQLQENGVGDTALEAVRWALRFVRYNNARGWPLENSWQAAFDGFLANCDNGCGPEDVPRGWIPDIDVEDPLDAASEKEPF